MAYPVQVTREQIVAQAIKLVERNGDLSLHDLARKLGIKAPSLYRHFESRDALIAEIGLLGFRKLAEFIRASSGDSPSPKAAAYATRRFAIKHPKLYRVMNESDSRHEDRRMASDVAREVLEASVGASISEQELRAFQPMFRAIRAFVHGFIMLEIAGQFAHEGNLDEAFERGLDALLGAVGGAV
jgi:AcrR family transcriptional regulator